MSTDPYRDMMRAMSEDTFGRVWDKPPPAPEPQPTGEAVLQSMVEADRILREAGWKPARSIVAPGGAEVPNTAGQFAFANAVCGHPPAGSRMTFVVKPLDKIPQAMAERLGLNPADYPDQHHEAALWLVEHVKQQEVVLETEATLDPIALAQEPEQVETPQHESDGETGEATRAEAADDPSAEAGGLSEGSDGASQAESDELGAVAREYVDDGLGHSDAIDADFTIEDLGGPEEHLELPAPEPEDFAPDEFAPAPEAPQDRFIGLDDLDRVRSLRIGDVATEALRLTTLIEQAVSEQEGEFASIQAYVVSHLDKHTGAFTPQDDASRQTYGRFLELSMARSKIALIDARRKDATAFLIAAGRDEVVGFDVQAAFV